MILLETDSSPVYALAFSPDGVRLVAGTKAGGVRFFHDLRADDQAPEHPPLGTPVYALTFGPDGAWLAVGGGMGWHAGSESDKHAGPLARPRTPPRPVSGLQFVTGTLLAVGVGDRNRTGAGELALWDVATNKPREPKQPAPDGVRSVAASPARKRVAWADGKRVGVWDIERSTPFWLPLGSTVNAVALSPDGDRLVAAEQYAAHVFDLTTRREVAVLKGHKARVDSVQVAPDGRSIVTGSWDEKVVFWDAATGRETAAYSWPVGRVTSMAFSPDGLRLAVGGNGVIAVVDVE